MQREAASCARESDVHHSDRTNPIAYDNGRKGSHTYKAECATTPPPPEPWTTVSTSTRRRNIIESHCPGRRQPERDVGSQVHLTHRHHVSKAHVGVTLTPPWAQGLLRERGSEAGRRHCWTVLASTIHSARARPGGGGAGFG